jgi:hypothetical protein
MHPWPLIAGVPRRDDVQRRSGVKVDLPEGAQFAIVFHCDVGGEVDGGEICVSHRAPPHRRVHHTG